MIRTLLISIALQWPLGATLEVSNFLPKSYSDVMSNAERLLSNLEKYSSYTSEVTVSRYELIHLLNDGTFAILCAWPEYLGVGKELTLDEVKFLEKVMEKYFHVKSLSYLRVEGNYNGTCIPNSYIVFNSEKQEMIHLAKSFYQASMIYSSKGSAALYHFKDHRNYPASNWCEVPNAKENYTSIVTTDKNRFKFTFLFE